jgi:uncharacterized protein (UPF0332 family)
MPKSDHYVERGQIFIRQAQEELDEGDLRQASEKAWGAAAQAVKAVAEERGWNHHSHAMLFDVVGEINDERRSGRLGRLFGVANQMHGNFYEDWMDEADVQDGIDTVKILMQRLERAQRAGPTRGFVPQNARQRERLARLTEGRVP